MIGDQAVVEETFALTQQLIDAAMAGDRRHSLALTALLSAYASVAMAHPCCHGPALVALQSLQQLLQAHAAATVPADVVRH